MSAMTIWGCASKVGGIAAEVDSSGETIGGHSYDEIALELPADGVIVDLDHDGEARGSLVYGEIADDDRVNVVAVLEDGRWLDAVEEPIYFSPCMEMVGNGVHERSYIAREAQLLGLALTLSPLTLGAQPIKHLAGDVRNTVDRMSWPGFSSPSNHPLLHRAVDHLATFPRVELRHRTASRLLDLRERSSPAWHGLKPGDRAPSDLESRMLPNGLWRSGHAGRVLRVR
jgi:hypothetical protein